MKFQDVKFKDPIFMRIDTKHSYFSNYFIICLPSSFSAVEIIFELCCLPKYNSCLCINFEINLTFICNYHINIYV